LVPPVLMVTLIFCPGLRLLIPIPAELPDGLGTTFTGALADDLEPVVDGFGVALTFIGALGVGFVLAFALGSVLPSITDTLIFCPGSKFSTPIELFELSAPFFGGVIANGFLVAIGEGETEGFGVEAGFGVGLGDGLAVGVGFGVGSGVGSGVGFGVGSGVGFGVGSGVGFGVGSGVGFGVGSGVGVGVGVGVGPPVTGALGAGALGATMTLAVCSGTTAVDG
jgi:hypothetical protein